MADTNAKDARGFLTPVRSLSGRYELLGRLGSGGMAEVYLALAVGLQDFEKIVVLKRVLPTRSDDPRYAAMFRDEARVAATLEHPNIVHTHDIGIQDDECFFTMEYLHGEDLKEILSAARKAGERLPLELALQIAVGCAAGLHHAHEHCDYAGRPLDIVHRDVSPSNIIVTRQSGVKLIDFGIAKAASGKEHTDVGVLKGKVAYMSPEQCRGEVLDRRSDLFALGIVLYEMITMVRPFKSDTVLGTVHKIVTEPPPLPSEVRSDCPQALERIVLKALDKDPARRYQRAFELQEELELATRDCELLALPGALGRYLEHLFGPKPHPWTARSARPPAVPRWAWAELDSTITSPREPARAVKRVMVAGDPAPMVATAPMAVSARPVPVPVPYDETRGGDTFADLTPSTHGGHRPISPGIAALKYVMLGGLAGGVLVVLVGLLSLRSRGDASESAVADGGAVAAAAVVRTGSAAAASESPPVEPSPATAAEPAAMAEPVAPVASPPTAPALATEAHASPSPSPEVPVPGPKTPADRASKKKGTAAEADELLARARTNLVKDPARAHRDAKSSYAIKPNQTALQIMGFAACRMRSEPKARYAHRRLRADGRTALEIACLQVGINLG